MNDVTARYKVRIRQWMMSLLGTSFVPVNLLNIKDANSYYILPVLSSRQDGTKVWLPGKKVCGTPETRPLVPTTNGLNLFSLTYSNIISYHEIGSFVVLNRKLQLQQTHKNLTKIYSKRSFWKDYTMGRFFSSVSF